MKKRIESIIFLSFVLVHLFAQENITIANNPECGYYKPLQEVIVKIPEKGIISVKDAKGQTYFISNVSNEFSFYVSGFPGFHSIVLNDKKGETVGSAVFRVDCETNIDDHGGEWSEFFKELKWNIYKPLEAKTIRYQGKPYFLLSDWLRDHVNILKGKKYFFSDIKDAIDLFGETQLENGMIFDFCMPFEGAFWEDRFQNKNFIDVRKEDGQVFQRVPVENDVEYWFVTGLYNTWKATDDDIWMKKWLTAAERALQYDMTSEYVWSEKYQLLKRAFTIDTWDFMPDIDKNLTGGDVMESIPGITHYGIMHGDNTGFAMACKYLAEMYNYVGEKEKAENWEKQGRDILVRLNKVSWTGNYYTHFVPEDSSFIRDLGVDQSKQVSLSNAYALNRNISHKNAIEIIKTYQKIKAEMPKSSPGEFYGIYPPFEKGFDFQTWHYVNGGVFPFIAGELANGTFNNGYENYGVDIFRRLDQLLKKNDGNFPYYWIGNIPEPPNTKFSSISLKKAANVDFSEKGTDGVTGWTQEPGNDISLIPTGKQIFEGIPFDIISPEENGRKSCIGLASTPGYVSEVTIPVNKKAESFYFLHTLAGNGFAGWIDINYSDEASHRKYVESGSELKNWWQPTDVPYSRAIGWKCKVAWQGFNGKSDVGVYVWGYNNPFPEKEIRSIKFTHSKEANKWFVLGLTISDQKVYFKWPWKDGQWLVNWNTGCVMNALIEGLAGVKDAGVSYSKAVISPKWAAADSRNIDVTVKYPASGNYMSYSYKLENSILNLKVSGVSKETFIDILLPENIIAKKVTVNNTDIDFTIHKIENSEYVKFTTNGIDYKDIKIVLE